MRKPRIVDDAKKCLKWYSVQASAINIAFLATWAALPEKFQDALPVPWVIGIAVALLVLGTAGRMIKQE